MSYIVEFCTERPDTSVDFFDHAEKYAALNSDVVSLIEALKSSGYIESHEEILSEDKLTFKRKLSFPNKDLFHQFLTILTSDIPDFNGIRVRHFIENKHSLKLSWIDTELDENGPQKSIKIINYIGKI